MEDVIRLGAASIILKANAVSLIFFARSTEIKFSLLSLTELPSLLTPLHIAVILSSERLVTVSGELFLDHPPASEPPSD